VNAVERLWDALVVGDWDRAAVELHPNVVVEWPHTGERFESREAFLAVHTAVPGERMIEVRSVITEGRRVASEVVIAGEAPSWAVASFFTIHDGRILYAVEYWVHPLCP
jgi:SnoaL-like polyketide cyclase.